MGSTCGAGACGAALFATGKVDTCGAALCAFGAAVRTSAIVITRGEVLGACGSALRALCIVSAFSAATLGFSGSAFALSGADAEPVRAQTPANTGNADPAPLIDAADVAMRAERWGVLRNAIFGDRKVQDGAAVLTLETPARAIDAGLVPIAIELKTPQPLKSLYLVIDNNPSPLASHFTFGPLADPKSIKLRVRINEYTLMHAVAETRDGTLFGVERFIKAAGGCSAPAGSDDAEALKSMGQMKLKLLGPFTAGKSLPVQLMMRHPNFNGMQMNQVTRHFTPARFIRTTDVTFNDASVFHMESDISISTDPVMSFSFVPPKAGNLKVVVRDTSDGVFEDTFLIPSEPVAFWDGPINGPVPATLSGGKVIHAQDLAALLAKERPVLIDASNAPRRPENLAPNAPWLPLPHPVIPDSVWIADIGLATIEPSVDARFRETLTRATAKNLDHPVVVYCHERCWLSWNAAKRAIQYGYRNVYWFPDGIEGWRAAGLPITNHPVLNANTH